MTAVSALTVFAVSACDVASGSSETPKQPSALELLTSDPKGALQKTAEVTDRADSVTLMMLGTAGDEKISMQGVLDPGDPVKAEMTMANSRGTMNTVRMIGAVFYVEMPAESRASMGGKRWLRLDPTTDGDQAGLDLTRQFDDVDPTRQVKRLLATEGTRVVGQETANGVVAVHYTVTTPVATYLGQLDAKLRAGVKKQMTTWGVREVTVDLWVDEQYRPRRAGLDMGAYGHLVTDYTDYGDAVPVETPPLAEIADLAELPKGIKGLTTGS
ncbi:hypothetical protein [Micromonospora sp. H61]|uniref:hypothetical protein n=1 Tax=unclassified Micromonospora TaxID=2617518 RepID=UPI001B3860CC|nr:hypothetical protein [Micromonospora sp. H61]MBQ0989213.1 hypothetical protein [Micromonospora sp. H61]